MLKRIAVAVVWCFSMFAAAGENAAAPDVDAREPVWTLVAKQDFEKQGDQSAWREDGKRVPGIHIARVEGDAHSGKAALRVTLPALADDEADAPKSRKVFAGVSFPALDAPAKLRMRLFVRGLPDAAAGKALIDLLPRNDKGIVANKAAWGKLPVGADWTEITLEHTLPAGVKTLALMIRFPVTLPEAAFDLDDISFELLR